MSSEDDDVKIYYRMGNLFLNEEKFASAIKAYQKALRIDPKNSATQFRLGVAYYGLKEFELAKKQFQTVLSLDHTHPNVNQCLANSLLELGDFETAIHYYFRQMEKNPWFETYYNLGVLFMMKERLQEALSYFHKAITLQSDDVSTQLNCGNIFLKQQKIDQAILCYEKANTIKPHDPEILHILSALKKDKTPENAPVEYIMHLFDQYAPYYEKHLTDVLKYDVPQKIFQTMQWEYPHLNTLKWRILDLGCGTGLCGALFKPLSKELIGVDLSESMLAVAKQKQIYDKLITADITQALMQFSLIDFIIAADVFTYIGNLELTFKNISNALISKGLFIFTVEKITGEYFSLQTSIRYAHSKVYLDSLISSHSFDIVRFENIILRRQKNEPVEGYLVLLMKRS